MARVRLECTLCPWVDPLASEGTDDPIVVPCVCAACQARQLQERRGGADRRRLKRVGPWLVRSERRRGTDRRKG